MATHLSLFFLIFWTVRMKNNLNSIDVILLAGGFGTRLRSIIGPSPKILAPLHDRVFLDYQIDKLIEMGARKLLLSLGYQADQVISYLRNQSYPIDIDWVVEDQPLGTAGGLKLALKKVRKTPVLIMNGDTWLTIDYENFIKSHQDQQCDCSLVCVEVSDVSRYGSITINSQTNKIDHFLEKGHKSGAGYISAGAYLFNKTAIDQLNKIEGSSLEIDFFQSSKSLHCQGYVAKDFTFLDIGTPESFAKAASIVAKDSA